MPILDTQKYSLASNWLPGLSLIVTWLSLNLIVCLMVMSDVIGVSVTDG